MEWCPRCQKNVGVWMKATSRPKGKVIVTTKLYHCIECKMFLKSTEETKEI